MNVHSTRFRLFLTAWCATLFGACHTMNPAIDSAELPTGHSFPPLPEAVTSFGAANAGDWLYVFGGHRGERHEYNAEDVSGSFHRLNLRGGASWEKLPSAEPGQSVAIVTDGRSIYRVGGMAARNPSGEPQDLRSKEVVARFDGHRRRWQLLPSLPTPRSSHDAAVMGGKLYAAGGWLLPGGTNKSTWHDTMVVLDLRRPGATWTSLPQPFQRRGLAVAALDGRLYCLGGLDAEGKTSKEVDVFDTRTRTWSKGPDLPDGSMRGFGSAAIAQQGRLYYSGRSGDLHRLSLQGDAWEKCGRLQHPRFFHRLVPLGTHQLLALGGEGAEGKLDNLEVLTPEATSASGQISLK